MSVIASSRPLRLSSVHRQFTNRESCLRSTEGVLGGCNRGCSFRPRVGLGAGSACLCDCPARGSPDDAFSSVGSTRAVTMLIAHSLGANAPAKKTDDQSR